MEGADSLQYLFVIYNALYPFIQFYLRSFLFFFLIYHLYLRVLGAKGDYVYDEW